MDVCMHVLGRARTDVRVLREASTLREAGYSVSIVDVESDRTRRDGAESHGVALRHVVMPSWFVPNRFKPWFLVKAACLLIRGTLALARMPADIYCAHDFDALPACYLAARLRRKRLVFDAHELPLVDPNVTSWPVLCRLYARMLRKMVPRCAGVVTVSPPIAEELRRRFGAAHVAVVRNIPPLQRVAGSSELRSALHLGAESRIALYQGNLQADRGLDLLVHAAPFLDPTIVIVMMGRGALQSHLERLIAEVGCQDRVKVIPPVPYDELLRWTASADLGLIVNPASYSANVELCLPNKLFEYLMAGLPVLSSRLVAVEELIREYGVGEIVDPLTPEVVGRAINVLMRDDAARDTMRRNARAATEQALRWEVERGRLLDLYAQSAGTAPRVCMHALRAARSDVRLVRAASALAHAGYSVSIVDVEHKTTRRTGKGVAGHRTSQIELSGLDRAGRVLTKHVLMSARWARYYDCAQVVPWLLFKAARMVRGLAVVVREPADVYHASDITALPACLLAARLRRKALVVEPYELPLSQSWIVSRRLLRAAATLALRRMLPRCQGIIVTSPPFANEVQRRFGGRQPVVVRNIAAYQPPVASDRLRQRLGLAAETRIALYQGGLQPDRGLDAMVRAAKYLDPATCIVLLGQGESQAELEEQIVQLGVGHQVKIVPPVPYAELQSWTASADIGLVTYRPSSLSVRLHLPNKVFEYLMAGLPILSSDLVAVAEIIRRYDVGHVVDSTEPAAIGHAINAMVADRDGLARMRRNALAACQGELRWEAESDRLVDLYEAILARPGPRP